jgi:hypothetical protein
LLKRLRLNEGAEQGKGANCKDAQEDDVSVLEKAMGMAFETLVRELAAVQHTDTVEASRSRAYLADRSACANAGKHREGDWDGRSELLAII